MTSLRYDVALPEFDFKVGKQSIFSAVKTCQFHPQAAHLSMFIAPNKIHCARSELSYKVVMDTTLGAGCHGYQVCPSNNIINSH